MTTSSELSAVIVGRGKVGRGLARALRGAGVPVRLLAGRAGRVRRLGSPSAVVFAVPDAAIADAAARVDADPSVPFLHCAGARGGEAFGELPERAVGAMHPLISFASTAHVPGLEDASFALSGDAAAVRAAKRLVRAMRGRVIRPEVGPRYHAAAALVANGSAALASIGVDLLIGLGLTPAEAARAMGALLVSVGENVSALGTPDALTGPVARGDATTVRWHREALAGSSATRPALAAYDAVAPTILAVARKAGLSAARVRALRRALREPAQRKTK